MVIGEGTIHDPSEESEMTCFKKVMSEIISRVLHGGHYNACRYNTTMESSEAA